MPKKKRRGISGCGTAPDQGAAAGAAEAEALCLEVPAPRRKLGMIEIRPGGLGSRWQSAIDEPPKSLCFQRPVWQRCQVIE